MYRLLRTLPSGVGLSLVILAVCSHQAEAQKKDEANAGKVVGTWKCTKVSAKSFFREPGFLYDFNKDGKFKFTVRDGIAFTGTYSVSGDKIVLLPEFVQGDKKKAEKTWKISKLTDSELVLQEGRDTAEFRKAGK